MPQTVVLPKAYIEPDGVGDGIADDTVAVQAALNNAFGLPVAFLRGKVYQCTGTITYPEGSYAFGDDSGAGLRFSGGVYLSMVNSDTTNGANDVTFRGFTIDFGYVDGVTGRTGEESHGIRIIASDENACNNFTMSGMTLKNVPGAALQAMNVRNASICGNRIQHTTRDGITVWFNSGFVAVNDNIVEDAGDDCIAINSEAGSHTLTQTGTFAINGNVLGQREDSVYGTGINVGGGVDGTIAGNTINYAQGAGIAVRGGLTSGDSLPSKRIAVTGNTIKKCGTSTSGAAGIAVSNVAVLVTVSGNVVDQYWSAGVQVAAGCEAVVVGNSIGAGRSGTSVGITTAAVGTVISANHVKGAEGTGIEVNAYCCSVTGNVVVDASMVVSGASYIRLAANNNLNTVTGNIMRRVNGNGAYGVRIASGTGDYNVIAGNSARGSFTEGFSNGGGGNNVLANNVAAAA